MPATSQPMFGVTWIKRLGATATVVAMMASLMVLVGGQAPAPSGAVAGEEMSLSMVELLGDAPVTTPETVAQVRMDVTGKQQRLYGGDGTGIDIALIDSGVAPVHGLDGPEVVHGPDLSDEGGHPEVAYLDTYGHGTHMAGIMVGQRTDQLGVAEGSRVVSVKVAGAEGTTTVPQVVAAIDWVIEHRDRDGLNIRVLNLSLGQANVNQHKGNLLSAAVERAWDAGIFVVVAAGNKGQGPGHLDAPAIDPYVMAVGAVDSVNENKDKYQEPTSFSAHGNSNRAPDIAAPGLSIASYRVPGSTVDTEMPSARYGDDLFRGSGTSQAAAVVSASAARILSQNPELTPDDLKVTLVNSATTALSPAPVNRFGAGPVRGGVAWQNIRYDNEGQNHERAAGPDSGIVTPTGATWSGGTWSGATWSGATWSGATWSGGTWSGATWSGATWSGATWSGATWSGATWSGATWSGATWSGATWSGATWSGNGWS